MNSPIVISSEESNTAIEMQDSPIVISSEESNTAIEVQEEELFDPQVPSIQTLRPYIKSVTSQSSDIGMALSQRWSDLVNCSYQPFHLIYDPTNQAAFAEVLHQISIRQESLARDHLLATVELRRQYEARIKKQKQRLRAAQARVQRYRSVIRRLRANPHLFCNSPKRPVPLVIESDTEPEQYTESDNYSDSDSE